MIFFKLIEPENKMKYYADEMKSPLGRITVAVDEDGALVWLYVNPPDNAGQGDSVLERNFNPLEWNVKRCAKVIKQVKEYFMHKRKSFDLDYKLHGTPFRIGVWKELTRIPYGEVTNYGDIARRIGKPKASRAIGQANHNNPIMLVVPCHRVIGSDRKIKGSGKGVSVREMLLIHEGVDL